MGWFTPSNDKIEELTEEIRALTEQIAGLQGEKAYLEERRILNEELINLKEKIEDYKIQRARQKEEHDKDRREVEHMVGLERNNQEFDAAQAMKEIEHGRREAVIDVREEALKDEREKFEKQMEFITNRFATEVGYLKEIFETAMDRVPNVDVSLLREVNDG